MVLYNRNQQQNNKIAFIGAFFHPESLSQTFCPDLDLVCFNLILQYEIYLLSKSEPKPLFNTSNFNINININNENIYFRKNITLYNLVGTQVVRTETSNKNTNKSSRSHYEDPNRAFVLLYIACLSLLVAVYILLLADNYSYQHNPIQLSFVFNKALFFITFDIIAKIYRNFEQNLTQLKEFFYRVRSTLLLINSLQHIFDNSL